MKNSYLLCSILFFFLTMTAMSQSTAKLTNSAQPVKISKHIYGHFAEHLGRCIYDGFYVGEQNSSIPNTNGIRNDVIDALKKLKVPVLRWPGGCFADTYHWKDGIGPKKDRPSMVNTWWGGVTEDNSFGTHDFLDMCKLIGAEPYIAGNVGSGTVQELQEWVQYVNFEGKSPMSDLRKKNGKETPWNVKYWGVGNEAWGCGGNMTAEYYANVYRKYATFMSGWSNTGMYRIASGANSGDLHWTEVLMRDIPHHLLEGVALHNYTLIEWNDKGPATGFSDDQYFKIMKSLWNMEDLVQKHSAIMDKYDPSKKIALVVDEWGGWYNVEPNTNPAFLFQQNTMRDAMIAGVTLNIFNNHADRIRMANLAQTINVLQAVILTDKEKIILTPTYHVMEMYNVHQDATLIPVEVNSAVYSHGNEKLKAVSVSASRDSSGITHISLVNIDPKNNQALSISLPGEKFSKLNGRILVGASVNDHNSFDQPQKVAPANFDRFQLKGSRLDVNLPPASVVVIALKENT